MYETGKTHSCHSVRYLILQEPIKCEGELGDLRNYSIWTSKPNKQKLKKNGNKTFQLILLSFRSTTRFYYYVLLWLLWHAWLNAALDLWPDFPYSEIQAFHINEYSFNSSGEGKNILLFSSLSLDKCLTYSSFQWAVITFILQKGLHSTYRLLFFCCLN